MKAFWIKVWEWIKNLFLGVKVLKKEQWRKAIELCDNQLDKFFDIIDENDDGIITVREIVNKLKKKAKNNI